MGRSVARTREKMIVTKADAVNVMIIAHDSHLLDEEVTARVLTIAAAATTTTMALAVDRDLPTTEDVTRAITDVVVPVPTVAVQMPS